MRALPIIPGISVKRFLLAVLLALLALFCIGWTLRMGIIEWATRTGRMLLFGYIC